MVSGGHTFTLLALRLLCRFDQYESFDSRPSSLNPRDLYRSGNYGYSEGQRGGAGLGGGSFEGSSSFGPTKPQMARQPRDSYPGPTWAGQRSPGGRVRGQGSPGFGRWQEPALGGGPGSHFPGGRGKPPSLLSHHMYPEMGVYRQGPSPQDFPGAGHFGGGAWAGHQRGRKRPVNRVSTAMDPLPHLAAMCLKWWWSPSHPPTTCPLPIKRRHPLMQSPPTELLLLSPWPCPHAERAPMIGSLRFIPLIFGGVLLG